MADVQFPYDYPNQFAAKPSARMSLVLRSPCPNCYGSGIKGAADRAVLQASGGETHAAIACHTCNGSGYREEHATLNQLYEALIPHITQAIVDQLPEIIERGALKLVWGVMES